MPWDHKYEIACIIIMTFSGIYPRPDATQIANALKEASDIADTEDVEEIIKWAEDYAGEFYEKYVK